MAKAKSRKRRRQSSASTWVERPLFISVLHRLTGRRFIPWKRLASEAGELAERAKAREVDWPPPAALSACLAGSIPSGIKHFDPMCPAVAAELPSIQRMLGVAAARLFAGHGSLDARARQQFLSALTTVYHPLLVWRQQSRHVLRVHPTLLEDFAHGEPVSTAGSDLLLPLPALYLELPRGITMIDPLYPEKRLNVRGALVTTEHEDGANYPRRELRIALIGRRKRRWPAKTDPIISLQVGLDQRRLAAPRVVPADVASLVHVPAELPTSDAGDPTVGELLAEAPNDIVVVLLRLLDYLVSNPEDVRRRRKTRKKNSRKGDGVHGPGSATSTYWVVGAGHARSSHAQGWKHGKPLPYVVHVRTHFRNQAYGPGHSLRRRTKIRHHLRGLHGGSTAHTTIQRLARPSR